ncbi:MAG: hypothetical protein OEL89_04630, partial [Candidatus Peregrinibacteria bacterium]|nr:hypothetical protein [Candidatus Peregrinibacteria bacterium]
MKKFFMLLVSAIFVSGGIVSAQQVQVLELFHGEECPHCHKEKAWLPELKEKFPNLEIREYEVWHNEENKAIFNERLKELGETPQGVPTNVIGNQVIVGFQADKIIAALSGETTPVPTLYDTPPTGEEGAESGEEGAEADSANDKF